MVGHITTEFFVKLHTVLNNSKLTDIDHSSVLYTYYMKAILTKLVFPIVIALTMMSCGGGGSGSDPGDSNPSPPELVTSVAPYLGAGMFAVDAPAFDVETALDILKSSSSPVLSFIPGVFGSDKANYPYMMDDLVLNGIGVHVQLYVLCGPCRRPRRDGSLVQFRPDLDIRGLESAIQWDPEVRSQYLDYVFNIIKPLITAYPQLRFTIVPELEDNQSDSSFAALLDLTATSLDGISNVDYQRNPMGGSRTRNYNGRTVTLELHHTSVYALHQLQSGDTLSLDGQSFSFRGENVGCPVDATYDEIVALIQESMDRGVNFHLWRFEWQGLYICGGPALPPEQRTYQFTHVDQIKELLSLR